MSKHKCPYCRSELINARKDSVYCSNVCKQAMYRSSKKVNENKEKNITGGKNE